MAAKHLCAVVLILPVSSAFVGCGDKSGAVWNSPYSADYKIVSDSSTILLHVTVKGPAAELAVILTDPKGESDHCVIEKASMITNSQEVRLRMVDLQEGAWVLTVKTINPEKSLSGGKISTFLSRSWTLRIWRSKRTYTTRGLRDVFSRASTSS